jgi:hypothetical protein
MLTILPSSRREAASYSLDHDRMNAFDVERCQTRNGPLPVKIASSATLF